MTPHHFSLLASALGLGLLTAGCLAEENVGPIDGLRLETLEVGDHGTNSLGTDDFHGHAALLWEAADLSINAPENAALAQLLADTGSRTLQYAIHCALPQGTVGPGGHVGWGHLKTTTEWTTRGLTLSEKLDLFTCLIVNINPQEVEVPFRMTGDSVTGNGASRWQALTFGFEEALWVTRLSDSGAPEYIAWPLDELVLPCEHTQNELVTRTCASGDQWGNLIPECNVNVRWSKDADCTQNPVTKNWTCLGRPAIKTWLNNLGYITSSPDKGCDDP